MTKSDEREVLFPVAGCCVLDKTWRIERPSAVTGVVHIDGKRLVEIRQPRENITARREIDRITSGFAAEMYVREVPLHGARASRGEGIVMSAYPRWQ